MLNCSLRFTIMNSLTTHASTNQEDEDLDLLNEQLDNVKDRSAGNHRQNLQAKFDDEASLQVKLAALSFDQQDEIVNQLVSCVLAEGNSRRSEEHTSELQSLMRTSYAVFCLKKKKTH